MAEAHLARSDTREVEAISSREQRRLREHTPGTISEKTSLAANVNVLQWRAAYQESDRPPEHDCACEEVVEQTGSQHRRPR